MLVAPETSAAFLKIRTEKKNWARNVASSPNFFKHYKTSSLDKPHFRKSCEEVE